MPPCCGMCFTGCFSYQHRVLCRAAPCRRAARSGSPSRMAPRNGALRHGQRTAPWATHRAVGRWGAALQGASLWHVWLLFEGCCT